VREIHHNKSGHKFPDNLPHLSRGSHPPGSSEMCAMEAAAWLAGEAWSDHPRAVHRAIARVAREVNDLVTDDVRQTFWPLILCSVGTTYRHRFLPTTIVRTILLERRATRSLALARIGGDLPRAWIDVLKQYHRFYKTPQSASSTEWLQGTANSKTPSRQAIEVSQFMKQIARADVPSSSSP